MAWSDEPTYAQIQAVHRWMHWHMTSKEASHASKWLKEHATRKEVSDEIKRLHDLYYGHKLNKEECFNSNVWEGYEFDESYEMPETKLVIDYGN